MVVESVPPWIPVRPLVVVAGVVLSTVAVYRLRPTERGPIARLRSRFLFGVPWGTVLTVGFVVAVYLFLQGGFRYPWDPLVIPFRSWSYFYPLGMVTAAFSHGNLSHLVGNVVGTVAFGSVVEYAVGHYPRERGAGTFTSWRTNPYARVLVLPLGCIAVGVFTALFALGPVVGFSGVVFALAGFAFVARPITAALALLAARIVRLVVDALRNPEVTAVARPRVVTPWWADVAIQGHAVGIIAGILLAVAFLNSRDEWPDPVHLWFGLLAFATFQGLWAVYVPRGGGRYVMFRWAGTVVVFVLVAVVALAVTGRRLSADRGVATPGRHGGLAALAVLIVLLGGLSLAAVPYNVAPVAQEEPPERALEVRDYAVWYADDVPDGYVGAVSIPYFEDPTQVNASGVVVASENRYVWHNAVLSSELANRGRARVLVGGADWRRAVYANRIGWKPTGNETVYAVFLRRSGENWTRAFTADPSRAGPVIGGRNVTVRIGDEGFRFDVTRGGERLDTVAVPENDTRVSAGGLTFARNGSEVDALYNDTRVTIATKETYRGRR